MILIQIKILTYPNDIILENSTFHVTNNYHHVPNVKIKNMNAVTPNHKEEDQLLKPN
jgi:hypothetical protein